MHAAMPIQHYPGPIIEQQLHPLDLRARHLREPCPRGKELAEQAIRVLIRASLPGRMRMGKIDPQLGLLGDEPMRPPFGPLVVGEGPTQLARQRPQFAREVPDAPWLRPSPSEAPAR